MFARIRNALRSVNPAVWLVVHLVTLTVCVTTIVVVLL